MKISYCLLAAIALSGYTQHAVSATDNNHLSAFQSERAFQDYLKKLKQQDATRNKTSIAKEVGVVTMADSAVPMPPPSAPATLQKSEVSEAKAASAGNGATESDAITNTQTQGVDEGGIVKKLGEYLIVLRRGRIFSIKAGTQDLRAISSINAYGPGISPQGAWWLGNWLVSHQ